MKAIRAHVILFTHAGHFGLLDVGEPGRGRDGIGGEMRHETRPPNLSFSPQFILSTTVSMLYIRIMLEITWDEISIRKASSWLNVLVRRIVTAWVYIKALWVKPFWLR